MLVCIVISKFLSKYYRFWKSTFLYLKKHEAITCFFHLYDVPNWNIVTMATSLWSISDPVFDELAVYHRAGSLEEVDLITGDSSVT